MSAKASNAAQVELAAKAQDFMDQLVRNGTQMGAAALAPIRAALRRALSVSRTPDELRHHLVELVRQERAHAFAKQLGQARSVAQLMGSVAVQDEIER